jgi:predicted RNase H-like nuclease (RuvC/YqgF family)
MNLIVGVDPGTTVAWAAFDLGGNLVALGSGRGMRLSDVVRSISAAGNPVLIACDRKPAPAFVRRIASAFSCRLFARSLDSRAKARLARRHAHANLHERDALAAAVKACNYYSGKFRKAERRLGAAAEQAKARIISGKRIS